MIVPQTCPPDPRLAPSFPWGLTGAVSPPQRQSSLHILGLGAAGPSATLLVTHPSPLSASAHWPHPPQVAAQTPHLSLLGLGRVPHASAGPWSGPARPRHRRPLAVPLVCSLQPPALFSSSLRYPDTPSLARLFPPSFLHAPTGCCGSFLGPTVCQALCQDTR